jgi:hypothetical protein
MQTLIIQSPWTLITIKIFNNMKHYDKTDVIYIYIYGKILSGITSIRFTSYVKIFLCTCTVKNCTYLLQSAILCVMTDFCNLPRRALSKKKKEGQRKKVEPLLRVLGYRVFVD